MINAKTLIYVMISNNKLNNCNVFELKFKVIIILANVSTHITRKQRK